MICPSLLGCALILVESNMTHGALLYHAALGIQVSPVVSARIELYLIFLLIITLLLATVYQAEARVYVTRVLLG